MHRPSMRRLSLHRLSMALTAVALSVPGLAGPHNAPDAVAAPAPPAVAEPTVETTVGWRVSSTTDGVLVSWRSDDLLPVTDTRPEIRLGDRVLGYPAVEYRDAPARGTVLRLALTAGTQLDPGRLEAWLGARRLDAPTPVQTEGTGVPYVAPPTGRDVALDPGVPGPHAVVSFDYEEAPVHLPGLAADVEVVGHAVLPDAPGPHPLVLFMHGRHEWCYDPDTGVPGHEWPCAGGQVPVPSHLGYRYLQRLLASQGYASVSVAANGINAQDDLPDGGASARSALIRHHLRRWAQWAAEGRYAVDMDRVLLVGHSRGGEGVDLAATQSAGRAPYTVRGQVLLAPTSFAARTAPTLPTVVLLPYCDGDVADHAGQRYVDIARDLAKDDRALRSAVLVMGANHNFFNTEWTPGLAAGPAVDDWQSFPGEPNHQVCGRGSEARLTAAQQRAAGRAYVAGAVRLFATGDAQVLPMYDGDHVDVPSTGGADVRSTAIGGDRVLRQPTTRGRQTIVSSGARTRYCLGYSERPGATHYCGPTVSSRRTAHWPSNHPSAFVAPPPARWALEVGWDRRGQSGGLQLAKPWSLHGRDTLDLRTIVDPHGGRADLRVRLSDDVGRVVTVAPRRRLLALPGRGPTLGRLWAQTLRVPLDRVDGIDLRRVTRVELVGRSARGRVWVLDLAGHRGRLPQVRTQTLPVVDLHDVRQVEGDGPGRGRLQIPLTVRGTLTEPAQLSVVMSQPSEMGSFPRRRVAVSLQPGQTRATVRLSYPADRADDVARSVWDVVGYPVSGVTTGRHSARAVIVDDDPQPTVTIAPMRARVREGAAATWEITLSHRADYYVLVDGHVVHGRGVTGRRLSTADVPAQWLRRHVETLPESPVALWRTRPWVSGVLAPGQRRATVSVPTLLDRRVEGVRVVSVRLSTQLAEDSLPEVTRTVRVLDPRQR